MRLLPRTPMFLIALAPLALAGAAAGPAAGATADTECSGWNGVQPVNAAGSTTLDGIAVVSACDVWAVGSGFPISGSPPRQAVIEHWTGSAWAAAPVPDPSGTFLQTISATSASDIWAVGDNPDGALILHYDGTAWTQSPTPPAGDDGTLWDVDGRTASDAWAVGWTGDDPPTKHALMMHWDGTNWTPSILPSAVTGDGSEILSVSADSATDAWALAATPAHTTLLHLVGSQWQISNVSDVNGFIVQSVVALSPTDAWAVGDDESTGHQMTMTKHWDGTNWTVVPAPSPGGTTQANDLADVTATSGSDVWAAGSYFTRTTQIPFVLHWNGSAWAAVRLPVTGVLATDDVPESISAAAGGQAWVSGFAGFLEQQPLTPLAVPVPVVPDVTGQQSSAANSNLTASGLTSTKNQTTSCPPTLFGQVVNQNPLPGKQEPFGQAVALTVCATLLTVPDVTGEDDATARSDLTAAGLHAGTITLKVSCTIPRGQVISQNPAGGASAPFGSSVSLTEATRSGSTAQQAAPHFCTQ
jgi:hypothetical protein